MNKDNYKKVLDQIHASEELKNKTIEKIENKKTNQNYNYLKYLSAVAVIVIVCSVIFVKQKPNDIKNLAIDEQITVEVKKNDLPRFKNIEELKKILDENQKKSRGMTKKEMTLMDSFETNSMQGVNQEDVKSVEDMDYSRTNIQVQNVDEADIVKTDGTHIYYVVNGKVYIIESKNLEIKSVIAYSNNDYSPNEIYINNDKLIVLGNYYEYETDNNRYEEEEKVSDYINVRNNSFAKAIVYDISNKENPILRKIIKLN